MSVLTKTQIDIEDNIWDCLYTPASDRMVMNLWASFTSLTNIAHIIQEEKDGE